MPRNATDGTSAIEEQHIDETIDDSFPASDPPSFTPVAHIGRPPDDGLDEFPDVDMDERPWGRMIKAAMAIAGAAIAIGAIVFAERKRRAARDRRRSRRRGLPSDLPQLRESASAVLTPLIDTAKDKVQSSQEAVRARLAA
jgi:hypothetical protein